MVDYFVEQTDDDGNVTFVRAEALELPDDAFYQDPRYRKVADSDAQRRLQIKELKKQMDALSKPEEATGESDDRQPTESAPKDSVPSADELIEQVMAKITAKQQAEQSEAGQRRALIDGLLEKHKLPDTEYRAVLENSTNPAATAEALGRAILKFDTVPGGDAKTINKVEDVMAKVLENLGLTGP